MRIAGGILLWLVVGVWFRDELEAAMLTHALLVLPALTVAGALFVPRSTVASPSPMALPAFLVALFSGSIWMLPRMLDASLAEASVEAAKLATLPLLVGFPLGWSWPRLTSLAKAFVWSNLVSMLVTLGWLYKAAPIRICNYYLVQEQELLGSAYLTLAVVVVAAWLPRIFLGSDYRWDPMRSSS